MHEFVFVFFRIQNRNNVKNTRDEPDYFLFNEQTNKQKNAFHPQILPQLLIFRYNTNKYKENKSNENMHTLYENVFVIINLIFKARKQ